MGAAYKKAERLYAKKIMGHNHFLDKTTFLPKKPTRGQALGQSLQFGFLLPHRGEGDRRPDEGPSVWPIAAILGGLGSVA